MGEMTLDEAKMSPGLDAGAKRIKEGRQLEGPIKSTGSVFFLQDRIGRNTKSECQKGEGEGRHDESRQEASLTVQCQTTGRGSTAGFVNQEPAVAAGRCKKKKHTACLREKSMLMT
jgi:hypothetical protein